MKKKTVEDIETIILNKNGSIFLLIVFHSKYSFALSILFVSH